MKTQITTEQYQSILDYIEQTKLVKKLLAEEIIDNGDLHAPDSEDAEILEDDENENPYLDFDIWITFSDIEKIADTAVLDKKWVSYIDSEYGFWIGVNDSSDMDTFVKRVVKIVFDYELNNDELGELKKGDNIEINKA